MIGALGSRYPVSVLLVLMAKGCWVLFVVAFFWNRDKRSLCGGGIGGGEGGRQNQLRN